MKEILYNRSVSFRDEKMNSWTIKFEVRKTEINKRVNKETLEEFEEDREISVCGEGGNCSGQCNACIVPRTESQKELLRFWDMYHLIGMSSGTIKQMEYLKSEKYRQDFDCFIKLFSGYNKEFRENFDVTSFRIMCKYYGVMLERMVILRSVIDKYMNSNPIEYILGVESNKLHHDSRDLYVQYLFLAINGLYEDRGYRYGTDWLYYPIPKNINEMIDDLCDQLEKDEEELSNELSCEGDFDMSADGFVADIEVINKVAEMRGCDETEAKRFIALGMHLECMFSDLNCTFEEVVDNLYVANGIEYYIGTEEELTKIARERLLDDDYLWREAVAAKSTLSGFKEWCEEVINVDGWCSVINGYDGRYYTYSVDGEIVCASRT